MNTLILISLIAAAYVYLRVVHPLRIRWWQKLLCGLALAAAAVCFKAVQIMGGGRIFAPDLPAWVILSYTWVYMLLMAYFLLIFVVRIPEYILTLCLPAWRREEKDVRTRRQRRIHAWLLAVAALLCSIGMANALSLPQVREVNLTLPARAPLRLALLADLHADAVKGADFMRRIVERTNALGADAIVIVGDFVDGSVSQRQAALEPLRDLRAPLGVYAVPGNHDYFSNYKEWLPVLSSLGICMLNNAHTILPDHDVALAGITDPSARHFGMEKPDAAKALSGVPESMSVIMLAHQPNTADQVVAAAGSRPLLQLSGHTHGGQMPGISHLSAAFNRGRVSGLYREPGLLYVSNGTSLWTGSALRLGVPSEITLITLTPGS